MFKKLCLTICVLSVVLISGTATKSIAETSSRYKVYMAKGKGASSILSDKAYHRAFKAIFSGHNLTIDTSSGANVFLNHLMSCDLAYMSLHSNKEVLVVGNGDRVYADDVAEKCREVGRAPRLVIIVGCSTLRDGENNFATALHIEANSKGRAYIGFETPTLGYVSDRYFRVFLAAWSKPQKDNNGKYLTLEEARVFAENFILERIRLGHCSGQGKIGQFGMFDARVANSLKIVGDAGMKVTDLSSEHNHHHSEPSPPSSVNPEPTEVPSSSSSGRKWRSAW